MKWIALGVLVVSITTAAFSRADNVFYFGAGVTRGAAVVPVGPQDVEDPGEQLMRPRP